MSILFFSLFFSFFCLSLPLSLSLSLSISLSCSSYISHVCVIVAPQFLESPLDVAVDVGENVTLVCVARGVPVPTVRWRRGDGRLVSAKPGAHGNDLQLASRALQIQSESPSLCLSIVFSNTHTHTHSYKHTHTHTQPQTDTHTHACYQTPLGQRAVVLL